MTFDAVMMSHRHNKSTSEVENSILSMVHYSVIQSNIEYKGKIIQMQVSMMVVSCFKYVRMKLFSHIMRSRNSWNANNNSKVML